MGNVRQHTKFRRNRSNRCWYIAINPFLARDVIYTYRYYISRWSYDASVLLSVTFVHCGHTVRWIPDIFACLDRWISLLLTDNAWPGSSDGMMPGFLVEEGGMEKVVVVAISLILLIFLYRWTITTWLYLFTWTILKLFSVILVENALCQKTVRLITTSS